MVLTETQKNMQKILQEDLKKLSDIVENNPETLAGYNHEDSKFNKGLNITLKRN